MSDFKSLEIVLWRVCVAFCELTALDDPLAADVSGKVDEGVG